MLGAQSRDTTRHDLAALGHEVAQALRILVIHRHRVVGAVGAATATRTAPAVGQALVVTAHVAVTTVSSLLAHHASSELSASGFSKSSSSAGSSSREWRSMPPSNPS